MLTEGEERRYARQLPLLGIEGQERLKGAGVLIAGAGGLGSVSSYYLAAAGVGHIRIADSDVVDLSNLNRQILHRVPGLRKALSAEEALRSLNPTIEVEGVDVCISESSIDYLLNDIDIIVDAMDSFEARYILNLAALEHALPLVHGAVSGFDGQVTTIIPGRTACLRCVFPKPPPRAAPPVIGATCGIIGSIQAMEAIKMLTGLGEPLASRLLIWDGRCAQMDEIPIERNERCPDCGGRSVSGEAGFRDDSREEP